MFTSFTYLIIFLNIFNTKPGRNDTFSVLKNLKLQILKQKDQSSRTLNDAIPGTQFHRISSLKETKIGNVIFGKTLLCNIEQTTSWWSEAIFLQSFKVLQGNTVEDIHLEFPDTTYKALQGSNPSR